MKLSLTVSGNFEMNEKQQPCDFAGLVGNAEIINYFENSCPLEFQGAPNTAEIFRKIKLSFKNIFIFYFYINAG